MNATPVSIELGGGRLSGLWLSPTDPKAALVLAHGAGAGMTHRSMASIADGLAARGVASLRFNFPYWERGSKRPDPPPVAHAAVRAAVAEARRLAPSPPLFAGGKSFGGRMTSQAEAISTLGVEGLVLFAFPLHPAGRPSLERAEHLSRVTTPMLFLSGTRDALADITLLRSVIGDLGATATLDEAEGADHSFHVPAKSGRKDAEVLARILDAAREWMLAKR